jgi:GTP-binding protein
VSSVRQAPRTAEFGEPGESLRVRLELKLVADVGLVGQPNAGKSTLLSVITNAKPEIADYAFTTLIPNLGIVKHRDDSFLVADIPGLIEGASAGRGLGDEFLRHVERTAVLLQLVDAQATDVAEEWRVIDAEIKAYGHGLEDKQRLTVLTKIDMILPDEVETKLAELAAVCGQKPLAISAPTHQGLTELLDRSLTMVVAARERRVKEEAEAEVPVIDTTNVPDFWEVAPEDDAWRLTGDRMEGFARRTNFEEPDAEARLRDIFHKNGVWRELRRSGAQPGEILRIGDNELIINE